VVFIAYVLVSWTQLNDRETAANLRMTAFENSQIQYARDIRTVKRDMLKIKIKLKIEPGDDDAN
jgi:hypothetical protein